MCGCASRKSMHSTQTVSFPRPRILPARCVGRKSLPGPWQPCLPLECSFCPESAMPNLDPVHGGADSMPDPRYDFSSNANPLGPCPSVLAAVRNADVTRYPDPSYTQLRATLAVHHRTSPERIVVGA